MKWQSFLLAYLVCIPLFAQNPGPSLSDSLSAELSKSLDDTIRLIDLNTLGKELTNQGYFDSARIYLAQALTLAEKTGYTKYKAKALNIYGITHFYQGQLEEALRYWNEALPIFEELKLSRDIALVKMNLGNAKFALGNYPEALDAYLLTLPAVEALKDSNNIALMHVNIGATYGLMQQYENSRASYTTALEMADKINDMTSKVRALSGIAESYGTEKKLDKAIHYYSLADSLAEQTQQAYLRAYASTGLANMLMEAGHLSEALSSFNTAIAIYRMVGDIPTLASIEGRIAFLYVKMLEPANQEVFQKHFGGNRMQLLHMAEMKIDSSFEIFTAINDLESLKNAHSIKSNILELKGDFKGALEHQIKYKVLSDSLLNMERDKKLTQTTMRYEFDKKEAADRVVQEKKDSRQLTIRNSIMATLAGSLLFLGVIYRQRNRIRDGKKRSDELLLNILPSEVAEELKIKGKADARMFDEVTVMFTDFKDFTQIAEKLSPADLVMEIHTCFEAFDHIITKYNIEKIKTIGDAYMCAGGLPVINKTNAIDVVNAATEIQQFMHQHIERREKEGKPRFEIRIGIHTGPVVAGIVGVKKFQYDIWGDTVNVAARMETSGEAGKVNISENTYALVKDNFSCTHRGKVHAKNKGDIDMYFVEAKI